MTRAYHICPYLALENDRQTACAFATAANHCYAKTRLRPAPLEVQQKHCLTSEFQACSHFIARRVEEGSSRERVGSPVVLPAPGARASSGESDPTRTVAQPPHPKNLRGPGLLLAMLLLVLLLTLVYWRSDLNIAGARTVDSDWERAGDSELIAADPRANSSPMASPTPATTATKLPPATATVVRQGQESSLVSDERSRLTTSTTSAPTHTRMPATATPTPTQTASPTSTSLPPAISPTPISPAIHHVVQQGQSLNLLARLYATTAEAILELSGVESAAEVNTGDELLIPIPDGHAAALPTFNEADTILHVVAYGEYMGLIAARYGVTVESIMAINPYGAAIGLYPGRVLFIPLTSSS